MKTVFSKTGSHVSMIISFVVFVTFVVFLFFILQPSLGVGNEKEALLDSIETSLLDYMSSDLNIISAKINSGSGCVQLNGLASASGVIAAGDSLKIKSAGGEILNYELTSAGDLKIQNSAGNTFFKIYESDAISGSGAAIGACTASTYNLGLVRTEKKVFEKKITDAILLYQASYDQLKQDIGLTSGDFGFDFVYDNGTIISRGEPSQATGVSTKQSSFGYIDADMNIKQGSMVIKTW